MKHNEISFSRTYTFGNHLYRNDDEIAEIIFKNQALDIQRVIIDDSGFITDFPGIAHPDLISQYSSWYQDHRVRFYSTIKDLKGLYAFIWQTQPEGRYWEDDDGFGGTSDPEINLYARMNKEGSFIEPFRFYSINETVLYGTSYEEELVQTLNSNEDSLSCLLSQIPQMVSQMRAYLEKQERGTVSYNIPGTVFQASLSLKWENNKWYIETSITKRFSGVSYVDYLLFAPFEEQKMYLSTKQAEDDIEIALRELSEHIKKGKK